MTRFYSAALLALPAVLATPAVFAADAAAPAPAAKPAEQSAEKTLAAPLKNIRLSRDSGATLSFGGEFRARYEYWNNFNTGRPDGGFLLTRVLLNADLRLNDSVRVFAEAKSCFALDRDLPTVNGVPGGRRPLDVDELDLQQGFVEVTLPKAGELESTAKAGRMALSFGKQRLISPLAWSNTMRSWDGVDVTLKTGGWQADAFFTQFVPVKKYDFNASDRQTLLYGAYATGPIEGDLLKADVYYLGRNQSDAANAYNGTAGHEERHTVGGRLFGKDKESGMDYDLEAAQQFGRVGPGNIDAKMLALELGWNAQDAVQTRLYAGADHTTGDRKKGGDVQTFNTLYPLGHAFNGQADIVGRQNLTDFYLGASAKPEKNLTLSTELHQFFRSDAADGIYTIAGNGSAMRPTASLSRSRTIGTEIDLKAQWKINGFITVSRNNDSRSLPATLEIGYSHFFAGSAFDGGAATQGNDVNFFYTQLQVLF